MNVVISQPMLFPWVGMLEQVMLADVYVDYPDVQFSKGSFVNRVQVHAPGGKRWMAVPLHDLHLGQRIDEVRVDERRDWRAEHRRLFAAGCAGAPYLDDALAVLDEAYAGAAPDLGTLAAASLQAVLRYYGLDRGRRFLDSRELGVAGAGTARVLDIVRHVGGDAYVTGHGARRYLDHAAFAAAGVQVLYMDYACTPYPSPYAPFDPYVSSLDLIANTVKRGIDYIRPRTRPWQEFVGHGRD